MVRFGRFELRTTDPVLARAFYATVLGHDRSIVWPLHERALANGARPHWLGHLGVADVDGAARAFVERGATQLGPTVSRPGGERAVILRDPGGAVLAVGSPSLENAEAAGAAWHVLNTNDAARAAANYAEQFGWELGDRVDVAGLGVFQPFAWGPGREDVGSIGDISGRPGVHPHWLFFFEVEALDPAIASVLAAGGVVIERSTLPSGQRFGVCDDPQGAAFGLWERPLRTERVDRDGEVAGLNHSR
jgi:predicted enzyme related to lactoylglutathione lyase